MRPTRDNPRKWFAIWERISFGVALLVVPAMLAAAGWTSQEFPNRTDRYLFEHMGETVLNGGTVYLDCWDNKPPGMCWLNALILLVGGRSSYAITIAAIAAAVLAVSVTGYGITKHMRRSVATATVLLFAALLSQRYFDACTNGTEFYAMVADSIAAVFAVTAIRRRTSRGMWFALLAGLAWGVGMLFKQTAVAGPIAAALVVPIAMIAGPPPRIRWLMQALLVLVGALIVIDATVAVLYYQGALQDAYYAVVAVNLYPQNAHHSVGYFSLPRLLTQLQPIRGVLLLAALGVIITFAIPRKVGSQVQKKLHESGAYGLDRPVVIFMLAWLVTSTYWVGAGPSHMQRYWHGVFVPLIWLCAQGLTFVLGTCRHGMRHQRWTAIAGTLTLTAVFFYPLLRNVYEDAMRARYYQEHDSERTRLVEVASRIQDLSVPTDRIYVWGYSPGLYRFSKRPSACRYSGMEKLDAETAFGSAMADEIAATLMDSPPRIMAVERSRLDDLYRDRIGVFTIQGLGTWFRTEYSKMEQLGGFELFLRKGSASPPPPAADQAMPADPSTEEVHKTGDSERPRRPSQGKRGAGESSRPRIRGISS